MKDIIELILNNKKKQYIYFKSLFMAKTFENKAKEYGITFLNDGACSLAVINEDKTAEYISYGRHYGIDDVLNIE